jgi:hypothetical protein
MVAGWERQERQAGRVPLRCLRLRHRRLRATSSAALSSRWRPISARKRSSPLFVRAEASCASSSFGVIFRAMLRLDPGEGGGSAPRPLAKEGAWRRRRWLRVPKGSRAAGRRAATEHAPSVARYRSGSAEVARKRRCRSRRQRSGTRPACPSCLPQPATMPASTAESAARAPRRPAPDRSRAARRSASGRR